MVKVISDVGHGLKAGLACCIISTKSSLLNSYSHKPNLLVFEGVTPRKLIASNLNVMHLARKRFIENEADEKLLRALIHKTRLSTTVTYHHGDQAFYKKNESGYWKGPGTVIEHDHEHIFVRHRGIYVHVNLCHLQLVSDSQKTENVSTVVNTNFKDF